MVVYELDPAGGVHADDECRELIENLKEPFRDVLDLLADVHEHTGSSPELSLAVQKVQEASMWCTRAAATDYIHRMQARGTEDA